MHSNRPSEYPSASYHSTAGHLVPVRTPRAWHAHRVPGTESPRCEAASAQRRRVVQVPRRVRVARRDLPRRVPGEEPLLPLFGRAVRPALGVDPPAGGGLDPVVADGGGRRQGVADVLVAERLQERLPGVRIRLLVGVVRPRAGVAVGLQFGADRPGVGATRIGLRAAEVAELVLQMVTHLVRDDVFLRERARVGTEPGDQILEEAGVEVRGPVGRAVERADVARGVAAARRDRAGEQHDVGPDVLDAGLPTELLFPHRVEAADGELDAAVDARVGVRTRLAALEGARTVLSGLLRGAAAEQGTGVTPEQQCQDQHHEAAGATADRDPPAGAAPAAELDPAALHPRALVERHRRLRFLVAG
ncbi:hypothetical protein RHRU231_390111 [Rhodococcus ruber]|uniref:Uncharacterized protein n=1 Tax=Rhodococcus ruber TaxID=1830 RepID=A0A098BHJ5_9NOCA|nr:hypothetical protein RHRU231_390111 [Rhodococcus ruber]